MDVKTSVMNGHVATEGTNKHPINRDSILNENLEFFICIIIFRFSITEGN